MQTEKEESNIDIKGTLSKFIKEDEPELSQEEAIMKFGEIKQKKSGASDGEDSQNGEATEEQEHLKRVKKELLASLERVKVLAKRIYGEENKSNPRKDLKISESGKQVSKKIEENEQKTNLQIEQHERE
jgi:hypothetical protein